MNQIIPFADDLPRNQCPIKKFECKAGLGNHCAHCIHFWTPDEVEEMELIYLEDLRL